MISRVERNPSNVKRLPSICLRRHRTTLQLRQVTGACLPIHLVLRPRQQLRYADARVVADRNLLRFVQRQLALEST